MKVGAILPSTVLIILAGSGSSHPSFFFQVNCGRIFFSAVEGENQPSTSKNLPTADDTSLLVGICK